MEASFETELAALRPKVLALARKFIRASGLRADAEDIAQDVLVRLWTARAEGAEIRSPEAWVTRAAKNLCVSLWRKARGQGVAPLPESLPAAGTAASPLEEQESRRCLDRALTGIPTTTRQLLQLRAAGMSLDEIAAVTDRPKGSIKTAISAARKQIINEWKKS